jgi:hypothetical protein
LRHLARGEPGHSILGPNMPIEEEPDCDLSKQATVENSPLAHAVCLSDLPWTQNEYSIKQRRNSNKQYIKYIYIRDTITQHI